MRNTISLLLLLALLACQLTPVDAESYPIEIINSRHYEGKYIATQSGPTFNYLDGMEGSLIAIFYGQPNRDIINSLTMFLLDPRYEDSKMVIVQIKQILNIGNKMEWANNSHEVTVTTAWKQREQDQYVMNNVSTSIKFMNVELDDYQEVQIEITMQGQNFEFSAMLTYYNQIVSTLTYSLYVSALVGIQIYSGYMLVKIMDAPNFVFTAKISLLTLSLCNIEDFSQTMNHIQYIMGTSSGYLFFIIPAIAYIILFIILDMKMLFLVWRSNNMRNMENPQLLRKQLTAFYIQFYLGLFLYLTFTYFFSNDQWMIVLRNSILIPQIIHNIRLGNNPGFNYYYIFGFVGSRMLLPVYQRLCPANRFALTPNITLVVVLISLFALQVTLLYLQSRLGSRFFVPKRFQPNYFNYKLKMKRDETNKEIQCSICLQNLFEEAPNDRISNAMNASQLQLEQPFQKQVSIMNTPCNHKFHEQCLTQWMQVKLECPSCRTALPPN